MMNFFIFVSWFLLDLLASYLTLLQNKHFLIDYLTGLKFSINKSSNFATLMLPYPENHNFGSRRPQIWQFFVGVQQN